MNSIEQDPNTGVVYIGLTDRPVMETMAYNEHINVDYADDGEPVGVEVLSAGWSTP